MDNLDFLYNKHSANVNVVETIWHYPTLLPSPNDKVLPTTLLREKKMSTLFPRQIFIGLSSLFTIAFHKACSKFNFLE